MLRFTCFILATVAFFCLVEGEGYNWRVPFSGNRIYDRGYKCPQFKCHHLCETYVGRDGCTYCGRCPVNSLPLQRCPQVDCFSHSGLKCQKIKLPNGCPSCQCSKVSFPPFKRRCPIPMCSQNCQLVPDRDGCYHCECYTKPNCPQESCPRSCTNYLGPDGCYHCDCGEEIAACPEINCNYPNCQPKFNYKTGCAIGCECQPNSFPQNLRSVPR